MLTIPWLDQLSQDLRHGLRALRKHPAFALVVTLTLALGIGATTAIFTVVNSVIFRPLPYANPERLVLLWERMPDAPQIMFSYLNFQDWRGRARTFENVAVYNPFGQLTLTNMGNAERVRTGLTTANLFDVLGVAPARGRTFGPDDDRPGAAPVAMITNGYWTRKFGRDSSVLGKILTLDGVSYTIVGVLPPRVQLGSVDVWVPVGLFANTERFNLRANHSGLVGMGRLKSGITLAQMQADLDGEYAKLRADHPINAGISASGTYLNDYVLGDVRRPLYVLAGAIGLVLLIACANVANLMMSRSAARSREMALRLAIGARRSRIVRQLLTESTLLSLIGGALGVGVAWISVRAFLSLNPAGIPRLHEVSIDTRVLAFAFGVSMLTGALFGMVPALQTMRGNVSNSLRDGSRGAGTSRTAMRVRSALMLAEVSLALMLLVGAGLLTRSFQKLTRVETGFDPSGVVAGEVSLPDVKYPDDARRRQMFTQLIDRAQAIPGATSVALATDLPTSTDWQTGVRFDALPPPEPGKEPLLNAVAASPGWFATMGMRVLSGRGIETGDIDGSPLVLVISEAVARKYFGNADPVGQRVTMPGSTNGGGKLTIVGVINDVANEGPRVSSRGTIYFPLAQSTTRSVWIAARTAGGDATTIAALRGALAAIDREIPLASAQTLDANVAGAIAQPRFSMLMIGAFAVVALLLAAIGIYGVISYVVAQRTHEIGVRVALGAQRANVVGMIARQVMIVTGAGIMIGVGASLFAARAMTRLLFGIEPSDPVSIVVACIILSVVALAAAAVPAWRASRLDPVNALRVD